MTTKKLTLRQKILVAGTLFGMFFGAGNLIFPVHLGQMAGQNALPASIGFIITAVGVPILGVAAIGVTHSDGLQTLSGKVGKGYGIFFTCLLYLTIGPLFAILRCATVSFTTGITPLLGVDNDDAIAEDVLSSGLLTGALMALIYVVSIVVGAQSRGLLELSENGGIALTQIAGHLLAFLFHDLPARML